MDGNIRFTLKVFMFMTRVLYLKSRVNAQVSEKKNVQDPFTRNLAALHGSRTVKVKQTSWLAR